MLHCWCIFLLTVPGAGGVVQNLNKISETVQDTFENVQENVQDTFESVQDAMEMMMEEAMERSTLAGQITPLLSKFILSKSQWSQIWQGITHVASVTDIAILLILGFALVPSVRAPYTRLVGEQEGRTFRSTSGYHALATVSQLARLAFVVYAFDMFKIFLVGAGFNIPCDERITHAFCYIVYTVWAALRLGKLKTYLIEQIAGETEGRIQVVNRLTNALLMLATAFIILDILNVEMGLAVRGVVAFGSVWTLVFSLAAKDTVANLLQGIILSASDRIYEGDSIQLLKTGFSGKVAKLGWLETVLRGDDEIMVTMPNADLLSQRVCNLSRIHQSQVTQTLQFGYGDSEKLPGLFQDIKKEIRLACPTVITDGSRPFRCYWSSFKPKYLEVVVDAHFRIKPVGDAYHENRQRCLQAIHKAVQKNGMSFQT